MTVHSGSTKGLALIVGARDASGSERRQKAILVLRPWQAVPITARLAEDV